MRIYSYLLAILISPLFLSAQQNREKHAESNLGTGAYRLYDSKSGKSITTDDIIRRMKNADILVFGEEHNDSTAHSLQAEILTKMIAAYPKTALTMEMFATDVQLTINEYLSSLISEKNFIKEARAWNNYADYRPMIEIAKQSKTDVIGGNVATRYSNAVTFSGLSKLQDFPESSKKLLPPLPVDTATGRYYDKFIETLGGHGMGNMKIYQTQNLWDASMAWAISQYAKQHPGRKILQINGRFHSDEKLGLLFPLKRYAPKLTVLTISSFAAAEDADWQSYRDLGDFILITPPVPEKK
ncbi:ChaN family lipoprotein [Pedobacter antarcticus]|uniref:ChaN family lipoprotein n=1 Tax=Pedobacter antarcticus TaxID=34086 RepID=UPI00292D5499|nr:ChaN family lipoprotein [Pedobacter antarcticus]